jgi:hypothetical protein
MPALNKQSLINLLIDSPLREAIKINLVDIVNNTADADLEKTYSTISKELEIYQKATERRLKLAGETIAQLAGTATAPQAEPVGQSGAAPSDTVLPTTPTIDGSLPPLPPMPSMPSMPSQAAPAVASSEGPVEVPKAPITTDALPPLQVPPLDLPPLPTMPTVTQMQDSMPSAAPEPLAETAPSEVTPQAEPSTSGAVPLAEPAGQSGDEAALQEIQKELDALKSSAAQDIAGSTTPSLPPVQQM